MKTRDLIAALQACDPTGELHVSVGNSDILAVTTTPAYYDGRQQILVYDENRNVIGVEFHSHGTKVVIHEYSVWDIIEDDPEVPVTYDSDGTRQLYERRVEDYRLDVREMNAKFEREHNAKFDSENNAKSDSEN